MKDIPHSRFRENIARMRWISFDLLPQVPYIDSEVICLFAIRRSPNRTEEEAMGEHVSFMVHQKAQQRELCRRETDLLPVKIGSLLFHIKGQISVLRVQVFGRWFWKTKCPSQQCPNTSRKFITATWGLNNVICALVERANDVLL